MDNFQLKFGECIRCGMQNLVEETTANEDCADTQKHEYLPYLNLSFLSDIPYNG